MQSRVSTRDLCSLQDVDPDDSFSAVPYEKGFNLLYAIQRRVGDDAFEAFVKDYIASFRSRLISSDDFKAFVMSYPGFKKGSLSDLDWDAWFFSEGMPPETPAFDDTLSSDASNAAMAWVSSRTSTLSDKDRADMRRRWDSWSSNQKCFMLDKVLEVTEQGKKPQQDKLSLQTLDLMQQTYDLNAITNSEVRFRWCTVCLRSGARWIIPLVVEMLSTQGRMKFTRPLYRDLMKSSAPGAAKAARETFARQANNYHPICRKMVSQDLSKFDSCRNGVLGLSAGGWAAVGVAAYLAWAVMRVRANKCPVPFVH